MTYVERLCRNLQIVSDGANALGFQVYLVTEVIIKLTSQEKELEAYRRQDPYKAGREDGYKAAFASGLVGEGEENEH